MVICCITCQTRTILIMANKNYVDDSIAAIPSVNLDGYATGPITDDAVSSHQRDNHLAYLVGELGNLRFMSKAAINISSLLSQ